MLRGLEICPNWNTLLRELGFVYWAQDRYDDATEVFERLIEVNPRAHRAWGWLSDSQLRAGDIESAMTSAEHAVELRPDNWQGWRDLGSAYEFNGRHYQAAAAYEKALDHATGNDRARALNDLAWIYLEEGRFRRAVDAWKQATDINPQMDWPWANVAFTAWSLMDDSVSARIACNELLQPGRSALAQCRALGILAAIEAETGHRALSDSLYAETEAIIVAELEARPNNAFVVSQAASLYARLGNVDRARSLLERLSLNHGHDVFHQRDILTVYAILGDYDAAIKHLERAIELGLDNTAVLEAHRDLQGLREDPRFEALVSSIR